MITQHNRLNFILGLVGVLLLIPFIGMQLTDEVNWSLADFIIAGSLLLATGLACEFVLRKIRSKAKRLAICGAILFVLLLVWAELAVGVFGTPFAGS